MILVFLILVKAVIVNLDAISETYKGACYSFTVSKFDKLSQSTSIEKLSKDEKKIAIFFGRKTCPDCVEAIFKINVALKKFEKNGYKFYYFDTETRLSKKNKQFLEKQNKVNEIPAILVFKGKKSKILYGIDEVKVSKILKEGI